MSPLMLAILRTMRHRSWCVCADCNYIANVETADYVNNLVSRRR